jgi:predicted outer membrane repeat protein
VNSILDNLTPNDGKFTLREAITRANERPGADVIVVPSGVFKIAIDGAGENGNETGDFDITDTLTIVGAGRSKTFIDGQQLGRVFDATSPSLIKVVLSGMTIQNGAAGPHDVSGGGVRVNNVDLLMRYCDVTGNWSDANGGGISNLFSTLPHKVTLIGCTVARNNSGDDGGGIAVSGPGVLTVANSVFRRNEAFDGGGGIFAETASLTRTTVSGNIARSGGGGIQACNLTVTDSMISGNVGAFGGAIHATTFPLSAASLATLNRTTVSGNMSRTEGGGIAAESLTLINSAVNFNTANGSGGGIWSPVPTLINATVSGNRAFGLGGGVYTERAEVKKSTISGNFSGDAGGGVFAEHQVNLTNCTVNANVSGTYGGGIAVTDGHSDIIGSTVADNRAGLSGGGVWATSVGLIGSTVSGNRAALDGGGLVANQAEMFDSTFSGNTAGNSGGGVWATTARLHNCTVVENRAQIGGGLFHEPGSGFRVWNSIVALNQVGPGGIDPDASGEFFSGGHNLIGVYSGLSFVDGVNRDFVGTSLDPMNPLLGPLAFNGGPTKTHRLLAGSKAIDAGDSIGVSPTDQRGVARIRDGNGDGIRIVDIGAFER